MHTEADIMKLYNKYEYLVTVTANRYRWLDKDDVMQYGRIGLYNACKTYDAKKGTSLKTHIIRNINWSIMNESKRDSLTLLSQKGNETVDRVSLDTKYVDSDGGESTLHELVGSSDEGFEEVETDILLDRIEQATSKRVREIVELRMQDYTLTEIGEKLDVSYQRVGQLLRQNKNKIKAVLTI